MPLQESKHFACFSNAMQPYIKCHFTGVLLFFCLATLKPTGFLISPVHVSEEAEDPLSKPPMIPIAQSSPLTLSPALKVGTCIKLCKCKSYILISFSVLVPMCFNHVLLDSLPFLQILSLVLSYSTFSPMLLITKL